MTGSRSGDPRRTAVQVSTHISLALTLTLILHVGAGASPSAGPHTPLLDGHSVHADSRSPLLWLAGQSKDDDDQRDKKKKGKKKKKKEKKRHDKDRDRDGAGDKVTLCHVPPGNADARHTLSVGRPAVQAHLAHGDHRGACDDDGAGSRGVIAVLKYRDRDGDGRRDDGEKGLEGWRIRVLDRDGERVAQEETDADGRARFRLPAGRYRVCEVLREGWINTDPGDDRHGRPCQRVEVVTGERERVRFGNRRN